MASESSLVPPHAPEDVARVAVAGGDNPATAAANTVSRHLPATATLAALPPTGGEKLAYATVGGLLVGGGSELFGFGAAGTLVGLGAASLAWYFSPEIAEWRWARRAARQSKSGGARPHADVAHHVFSSARVRRGLPASFFDWRFWLTGQASPQEVPAPLPLPLPTPAPVAETPAPVVMADYPHALPPAPGGRLAVPPVGGGDRAAAWQQRITARARGAPTRAGASDEHLDLGTRIATGARYAPHIDDFHGRGIVVAGVPMAGKSNGTARLCEQIGLCWTPLVVFDLKGEYRSLLSVVPNGILAGAPEPPYARPRDYFPVTRETARALAHEILAEGYQAVVDLSSYGADLTSAGLVVSGIIDGLMDEAAQLENQERTPCWVVLEEAHDLLPERNDLSPYPHAVREAVKKSYFRLINVGRSYGFTNVFITTRLANVAKWAIAASQCYFLLRHSEKNDLERCAEAINEEVCSREGFERLPTGHAVVKTPDGEQFELLFDLRESEHTSHTPSVAVAHARYRDRDRGGAGGETHYVPATPTPAMHPVPPPAPRSQAAAAAGTTWYHDAALGRMRPSARGDFEGEGGEDENWVLPAPPQARLLAPARLPEQIASYARPTTPAAPAWPPMEELVARPAQEATTPTPAAALVLPRPAAAAPINLQQHPELLAVLQLWQDGILAGTPETLATLAEQTGTSRATVRTRLLSLYSMGEIPEEEWRAYQGRSGQAQAAQRRT